MVSSLVENPISAPPRSSISARSRTPRRKSVLSSGTRGTRVVALTEQRSRFLVEVAVNGATGYSFVLDTGSTAHFISTRLVEQLGLREIEQRPVRGYDGRRRQSVVGIARLNVGGVDLGRTNAIAWGEERLGGHDGAFGWMAVDSRNSAGQGTGDQRARRCCA